MSFVIGAIHKNKNVYISADTKANSKNALMNYPDIQKVFKIDENTLIGIAGDYHFAKEVVSRISGGAKTEQQLLLGFTIALQFTDAKWRQDFGKQFNAVFMLGGRLQGHPYMKLITFAQGKFSLFDKPFVVGDYQYFLSNPVDLQFEACQGLCEKILSDTSHEDPEKRLERIVHNVAYYSDLVNDKPTIHCCLIDP